MTRTPTLSYTKILSITLLAIVMVLIACFAHAQSAWGESITVPLNNPTQAVSMESVTPKVPYAIPVPLEATSASDAFTAVSFSPNQNADSTLQATTIPQLSNDVWMAAITLLSVIALGAIAGAVITLRMWRKTQQCAPVIANEDSASEASPTE